MLQHTNINPTTHLSKYTMILSRAILTEKPSSPDVWFYCEVGYWLVACDPHKEEQR